MYDVEFQGKDPIDALGVRVEAFNAKEAITLGAEAIGVHDMTTHNWGVSVRLVDAEAEAKLSTLYAERDIARSLFEEAGFMKVVGIPWYKHSKSGLVAYVDEPEWAVGDRFAGIYMHEVDIETNIDKMIPWLRVSWYGDGADYDTTLKLLMGALSIATKGV
jgi:hypothetical protein